MHCNSVRCFFNHLSITHLRRFRTDKLHCFAHSPTAEKTESVPVESAEPEASKKKNGMQLEPLENPPAVVIEKTVDTDLKVVKPDADGKEIAVEDEEDEKEKEPEKSVGCMKLYRYADKWDWVLMISGGFFATFNGAMFPLMNVRVVCACRHFAFLSDAILSSLH